MASLSEAYKGLLHVHPKQSEYHKECVFCGNVDETTIYKTQDTSVNRCGKCNRNYQPQMKVWDVSTPRAYEK